MHRDLDFSSSRGDTVDVTDGAALRLVDAVVTAPTDVHGALGSPRADRRGVAVYDL
jgi:hypothetical protein